MRPYRPRASAKIKIRIMPTKSLSCCPTARTPASPTIPMAIPAARPLILQNNNNVGHIVRNGNINKVIFVKLRRVECKKMKMQMTITEERAVPETAT